MPRCLRPEEYTVGWICALPVELAAAQEVLDEEHEDLEPRFTDNDENVYSLGSIGGHNVAIVCLPAGRIGNNPAAAVAMQMRATFKAIRFGLMVGIGGGVPSTEADIWLGDVVVSQPHQTASGVVQYDSGKTTLDGFQRTGSLNAPPQILLGAVARVQASELRGKSKLSKHISKLELIHRFQRKTAGPDVLYEATYDHEGGQTCDVCSSDRQETRQPRENNEVAVHYGTIASGNQVIKDGKMRDKLSTELGGVLCFEMEAAGLMNIFPCLVIRGICDYADSHKNKRWQPYAAGTAAAYAKEVLLAVQPVEVAKARTLEDMIQGLISPCNYPRSGVCRLTAITVSNAPQPKPSPSSTVPFRRDDDFISRDALNRVHQICARPAARAALVGLGGVGRVKSQIAIEYAYQLRDKSPDVWVFWVHAGTQARLEEGYRKIAEATKMDGWNDPKTDVLRLVRAWLCDETNGRWVMIVDNADDSNVFFLPVQSTQAVGVAGLGQAAEPLSDFLPQSRNGAILVTSRSRDVASRLTGSNSSIVEVKPMDVGDGLALLQKKLSSVVSEEGAVELLQALDYMPLAIAQAAAFIEQRAPRMTISRYVDEVRKSDTSQARLLQKDVGDSRRDGRASNSIITTWQISFEHIWRHVPTAARLLSLMSLFDRQGIPESLLYGQYEEVDGSEADFDDDIHTLTSYSLVEMGADGSQFEMHRLVQFSTKRWLELNQELEIWKERYVMLMDGSYPVGRHENWPICQALFPHVQAAAGCRPDSAKALVAWASALFKGAWYAREIGQYGVAKDMGVSALEAREAILGVEHPDTLNSMNGSAIVLQSLGDYKAAEQMNRRALEGYEKALGKEHPVTLTSVSNLALVLSNQGKYEEAEEMNQRALEGTEKALGKEHPDTLTSVSGLASVLQYQGKYEEAEEMNWRALDGYEKALGKEYPSTLTSVSNLALVLGSQGKYEEAEEMNRRALEGREKAMGKEHPDTLTSVSNLALVLRAQGKYEEAEEMNQRALEGYEKALGKEHPDTLTSVYCLAFLFHQQKQYQPALELYQRANNGFERMLGSQHPTTVACARHFSSLLQQIKHTQ
ncbi:putative kinesin [Dendryphion nanum]|uniref:Kinesin n=1 Tax=Dendryphion nanum TaxID=256645 RepID=A0A9P9CXX2_9PLEO|nr:putative kinesin [Dendryphion nanum]